MGIFVKIEYGFLERRSWRKICYLELPLRPLRFNNLIIHYQRPNIQMRKDRRTNLVGTLEWKIKLAFMHKFAPIRTTKYTYKRNRLGYNSEATVRNRDVHFGFIKMVRQKESFVFIAYS